MRIWGEPVERHDSTECFLWHKPINTKTASSRLQYNVCVSCKRLINHFNIIKNRAVAASPGHKEKWTELSSNRPLKYPSPASQTERLLKSRNDRQKLHKTVLKYDNPLDVELSRVQDEELTKRVQTIEEKGKEYLEAVFSEADQTGEGSGDDETGMGARCILTKGVLPGPAQKS